MGKHARILPLPWAGPFGISGHDLHLFNEGRLYRAYDVLGSHLVDLGQGPTMRFAVWAPNAEAVSVVGDFNGWNPESDPLVALGDSGVWAGIVSDARPGQLYKYAIAPRGQSGWRLKSDPYAQAFEPRPGTAARAAPEHGHAWHDRAWMAGRRTWDWLHAPISIYELHAGSWLRHADGRVYGYDELADRLIPYVKEMGYSHIELLPLAEHPLDESWGYQTTGYFAATSRYGDPDQLRRFIDRCHGANIGVFLDWTPAHFPSDDFGLARFDGTALYEHADPRQGVHQDWGTLIFNYGRHEVRTFLLSSAHYWLSEFHLDGLRVDAVASMLYLDYSRPAGAWVPNRYGGRENLDAIDFLRALNVMVHQEFPGALTIAEESTTWPLVSRPAYRGGLGFSMKWNMGWMNDTLSYMALDPVHRRHHHDRLTFGQLYAYSENFVLPLSHDEVVHGKGSLLHKMPGDPWQQFANLRLLLAYQMTAPGKKLGFMGGEFGQRAEWRCQGEIDWGLLQYPEHRGLRELVRDLNHLYRRLPALHEFDFESRGFEWLDCHDCDQSVVSFLRRAREGTIVVVALNFTPMPRERYRIGLPRAGRYREILNSDAAAYGGGNHGNRGAIDAAPIPYMGRPCSAEVTLPPLAAVIFEPA